MTSPNSTPADKPQALPPPDAAVTQAALARNKTILDWLSTQDIDLPAKFLVQMAHLTSPATVWKYVESAATKSAANLVMLDLEDCIPRGDDAKLGRGAGQRRPRLQHPRLGVAAALLPAARAARSTPATPDIATSSSRRPGRTSTASSSRRPRRPDEVRSIDHTLTALERKHGLPEGKISIEVLIESASAEEQVFEIARSSQAPLGAHLRGVRLLGLAPHDRRAVPDGPPARRPRARAHREGRGERGIPAIAEMTLNYPTKEKTEAEQKAALDECRQRRRVARSFGFRGKWTGIPAQTQIAHRRLLDRSDAVIDEP